MVESKHKKTAPLIARILAVLDISAPTEIVAHLALYASEVMRWGRKINLTGASEVASFVAGPLFDALTLVPVLRPEGSLVDVGSGAGLPGIPAALLAPALGLTLVEPRAKRALFLRHVTGLLGLDLEIIESRAEALGQRTWGGTVAQAVWPPARWLERGSDLVATGGRVYALTSAPLEPGQIPSDLRVDVETQVHRPLDQALRVSTRLYKTGG